MKKIIAFMILCCLCIELGACGKKSGTTQTNEGNSVQTETEILFQGLNVGDTVTFGSYEQDNMTGNGKEQIRWLVLNVSGDRALLLSESILTGHPFNSNDTGVTWEDSTLRAWLNSAFLEEAFTPEEQMHIKATEIYTQSVHQKHYSSISNSYTYTVDPLPDCTTTDKVFILSAEELATFFPSENARIVKPTTFVKLTTEDAFSWWTRTPGAITGSQKYVDDTGSFDSGGAMNSLEIGVRPAIWVKLDSK